MKKLTASVLGILVASTPVIFFVAFELLAGWGALAIATGAVACALVLAILAVALPIILVLNRFGLVSWWLCAFVGILGGLGVCKVVSFGPLADDPFIYIIFGALGLIPATLFWLTWRLGTDEAAEGRSVIARWNRKRLKM